MNLILNGALGHMSREVARMAQEMGHTIAFGVDPAADAATADFPLYPSFGDATEVGEVIIDFSRPDGLAPMLAYAVKRGIPAVVATTGCTPEQERAIDEAAQSIAIFRSANMSVGVALLSALAQEAARVLGDAFDVEIVEAHHNRKVDAPSGTALMLYNTVKDAYDEPRRAVYGRDGRDCKRQHQEIGIHALRGGTVTGEHEVCFFGTNERIKLCHTAENRSVFASGALCAAKFIQCKEAGRFDMNDLVRQR